MSLLKISNLRKSFSGEVLFENVSLDINEGEKVALIGENGVGKSTIVKMILGELPIDGGEITIARSTAIGYLDQNVISDLSKTLIEEMSLVFHSLIVLENTLNEVVAELAIHSDDIILKRYSQIEDEFLQKGGYEYHYFIDMILTRFGFKKADYDRVISTFSGGERTRIAFAKLLLQKPELLILDEPTNHMDIEIIEWLEDYLRKYDGAVLVITHDKYFINKVVSKIYEIDQKTASMYLGNFDSYEIEKVRRFELLLKAFNKQTKEIMHLQSFVDRFRYKATKAKSAQDRIKKIARIDRIERPTNGHEAVHFAFKSKRPTEAVILEAKNLTVGYDKPLQTDISFVMRGYEKIGIIGPNGIGKTTLIKTLMKDIPALSGEIIIHKPQKVGYFDQNLAGLNEELTVLSTVHDRYPQKTLGEVRSLLARFLFVEEDVFKTVKVLSGGEKVRLTICLLMLEEPELLILDEPTNHLDLETKNIVEDVFESYEGPIIFISHDRYFINRVATKIVHLDTEGTIIFDGNYDEFKEFVSQKAIDKPKKTQREKPLSNNAEIRRLEAEIDKFHHEIEKLRQSQFEEWVYNDPNEYARVVAEIDEKTALIDARFAKIAQLSDD
ncbi:MAG: ABC-F family ATP-binding cassette domain-containing protein [Candidatus Izemoplasmatales bacterium]|jgi:ATP-binding cassette subfamily F protein 3|nr:ABC-F family ATP-binding cassette domain-containing protein [Candidatus Izemoplasmatales bacterium]